MKVFLSLDEIDLGYLIQTQNEYKFVANETGIEEANRLNSIAMTLFKLNKTGEQIFDEIPHVFSQFLVADSRKDLCEKAQIKEDDCEFEKLFKIAQLNIMKINFNIHI